MEFEQHASVISASGDTLGHLARVVLKPASNEITHIVVRTGSLFTEEKVVPIEMVALARHERIWLRQTAGDLDELPCFEDKQIVERDEGADPAPVVISQPLAGLTGAYVAEPVERLVTRVVQHIPEGTVALKEGARVTTPEGKHLGKVTRIIVEPETDQATYLLVSTGLLPRNKRLIPMARVTIRGEAEVRLAAGARPA